MWRLARKRGASKLENPQNFWPARRTAGAQVSCWNKQLLAAFSVGLPPWWGERTTTWQPVFFYWLLCLWWWAEREAWQTVEMRPTDKTVSLYPLYLPFLWWEFIKENKKTRKKTRTRPRKRQRKRRKNFIFFSWWLSGKGALNILGDTGSEGKGINKKMHNPHLNISYFHKYIYHI